MAEKLDNVSEALSAPFPSSEIKFRAGATNGEKTRALALAYIESRAVMDRLDDVVGVENWQDAYRSGPDGGVVCAISLCLGEWISKEDGAPNTQFESVKGGLSDAFKRAGVKWGIGRYLYRLEGSWVPCQQRGKTVVLLEDPVLPDWAVPENDNQEKRTPIDDALESEADPLLQVETKKVGEDAVTMFWQLANKLEITKDQAQQVLDDQGGNFVDAYDALSTSNVPPEDQ